MAFNRESFEPSKVPDRIYREQDIPIQFGDAFDQVKAVEGYADDEEYSQPYRFLEHWYLVKRGDNGDNNNDSVSATASSSTSFKRRLPIPPQYVFTEDYKNCVIAGWLQPFRSSSSSETLQEQQAIFVELTEMEFCSFDRSKLYRGYWVHTPDSLYWLRQPDTATSTCTSTNTDSLPQQLPSQEQVHLPARTQLAVLSNVLDHVLLSPNAVQLAKKTVSQVHKEWISAQLADADSNHHVKEPFNKVLLAKYKAFVGQHLIDPGNLIPFHPAYTAKSSFIKSLKAMSSSSSSKSVTAAGGLVTPAQWLAWTVESEAGSHQYPWGESTVPLDPALGDSLEATLSDVSGGGMTMNAQLEQSLQESDEIINAKKKKKKVNHGNHGVSEMMSITLVVEGAPLPNLLKLSKADYSSYHDSKNANDDNSDDVYDVQDELGDGSDSGDESYGEATTGKRLQKLSKKKSQAVATNQVPKKRAVSSHAVKERPVKKVKVAKVEIPNDLWSPDRTAKALLEIRHYLNPRPKPFSSYPLWESVQIHDFSIADGSKAKELLLDIGKWEIHLKSLECLLVVTESFGNSCRRKNDLVAKKLVSLGKSRYAIIIFDAWRRRAAALLQERLDTKKSVQDTPELYLLISILNLITDCHVVKSAKNLDALTERGLDWELGIQEIHLLCEKLQNHDLSSAYDRAKTYVESLRRKTTVGKTSAEAGAPVQNQPEASHDGASVQSKVVPDNHVSLKPLVDEALPLHPESSIVATVPRKTVSVREKVPSEQEEAHREERRKRILAAVASTSASSQIVDTDTPARSSSRIAPDRDSSNLGSRNDEKDSAPRLSWGCAGDNTYPGTSWGSLTMDIRAGRFGGDRLGSAWGSETVDTDTPITPSTGGKSGTTDGGRAGPEPLTLANEGAVLALKVSDTLAETARSSTHKQIVPFSERHYGTSGVVVPMREASEAADYSSNAKAHKKVRSSNIATGVRSQSTSGLGRGRDINFPAWMARDAPREGIETTQPCVIRTGVHEDCSSPRLAPPETSGLWGDRNANPSAWMAKDEPKVNFDDCYSGDKRSHPIERDGRSLHISAVTARERGSSYDSSWESSKAPPPAASSEARYRVDSRPASSERDNSSSYPSAPRERETHSAYHSASEEIHNRSSYRSVRPAERTKSSRHSSRCPPIGYGHLAAGLGRGIHKNLPAWMSQSGSERLSEPRTAEIAPPPSRRDTSPAPASSYAALAAPSDASKGKVRLRPDYRP